MNSNNKKAIQSVKSEFLLYKTEDGQTKIEVRLLNETVWLSQKGMARLFQKSVSTINEHIKNIFEEGELEEKSTIRNFRIVQKEGGREVSREIEFYNLDVIISVGYRVKSHRGTQFRIWATKKLREYIIKGFTINDERLKNPDHPFDYFDELLERIQEIRTSEKRFYRKITDVYATSIDYDPTTEESINFFKTVQNKLHWAITGKTAAELIKARADKDKPHMGLTNWRGPKVRKADATIAKNYLKKEEIEALNNLVEQYLLYAEGQALKRESMYMKDWIKKLHAFLKFNEKEILKNAGKVSHKLAEEIAHQEYQEFKKKRQKKQDEKMDVFDKQVQQYLEE
ncbi:MAG: virulence RhuM family protein [Patescibacteria group bacterium]|nr:virulence RhuM family protein [Patescibacteria group bacterium]